MLVYKYLALKCWLYRLPGEVITRKDRTFYVFFSDAAQALCKAFGADERLLSRVERDLTFPDATRWCDLTTAGRADRLPHKIWEDGEQPRSDTARTAIRANDQI